MWDPVKKKKLPMLGSNVKTVTVKIKDQLVQVKEEHKLISRSLIVCRTHHDIDLLSYLGNYEFSVVPRSLFTPDTIIKHLKTSEFLSNVKTKQDMTIYLSKKLETALTKTNISYVISCKNKCLRNVMDFDYGLQGHSHKEADTLIILHCFLIAKIDPFGEVVIVCSDTDVLLMLLYHYQTLCTQTIMRVGRGDHKGDINIGKSFEALGDAKSRALVGFHAFTGCDQAGKFNDQAIQLCWNIFIASPKRLLMLLCYLRILSNIQRKNVLMA